MLPDEAPASWVDQYFLRGSGPGGALAPFSQAGAAADLLVQVAKDRAGLSGLTWQELRTIRFQSVVLADFVRVLESDFASHVRRADEALARDPVRRASALMSALTGSTRAVSSLIETCLALLGVAEDLAATPQARARVELVAAIEAVRTAACTAQVSVQDNLFRITDSVVFDQLSGGLALADHTIGMADRLSAAIRAGVAPGNGPPPERSVFAPQGSAAPRSL